MIPVRVDCPHCEVSLMDEAVFLDGNPSIRLRLSMHGEETPLQLSSIYGSFRFHTKTEVKAGEVTGLSCGQCGKSVLTDTGCPVCNAPLASLQLAVGGRVFFCARRGCKSHRIELNDPEKSLAELTRMTG